MRLIRIDPEEMDGSRFDVYLLCDDAGHVLRRPKGADFADLVTGSPFEAARKQLNASDNSGVRVRQEEGGELYHVAVLTRHRRSEAPAEIRVEADQEPNATGRE